MFRPRYRISPPLLASIKRIAVQVHNLNKQRLIDDTVAALEEEARGLAAEALGGGDELTSLNVRRTLADIPAGELDLELLLRLHFRLGRGMMADRQRGRLRREAVPVRGPGSDQDLYWPADPQALPFLLGELTTFVRANQASLDPVILAGLFHRQFLLIRPFAGLNRQVAWLATRGLLSGLELGPFGLMALENHFGRDATGYAVALGLRGNYYAVSAGTDFTPWLEYFAGGVAAELATLEERLRRRQASPATSLRAHHRAILKHIDEKGFITDRQYARFTDRAKATRSLDFKKLLEMGLIVREGRGRGTFYRRKA